MDSSSAAPTGFIEDIKGAPRSFSDLAEGLALGLGVLLAFKPLPQLFTGVDRTITGGVETRSSYFMVVLVVAAFWLFLSARNRNADQVSPLRLLLNCRHLLSLLVVAFSSLLWSVDPQATVKEFIYLFLSMLLCATLVTKFGPDGALRFLLHSLILICLLSILMVMLVPASSIHHATDALNPAQAGKWRGAFNHKNLFGQVAVMLLVLALTGRKILKLTKFEAVAGPALGLVCLIYSGSASPIVVGVFFVATSIFAKLSSRIRKLTLVAVVSLGSLVLAVSDDVIGFLAGFLGKDADLTGRTAIWALARMQIEKNWLFGTGYGTVSVSRTALQASLGDAAVDSHNAYLDQMLGLGVVGLLPFLWLGFSLLRHCLNADTERNANLPLLLACAVGWLLAGLTEVSPLRPNNVYFICGVTAFLAIRYSLDAKRQSSQIEQLPE
jgi:O-antigen ligase